MYYNDILPRPVVGEEKHQLSDLLRRLAEATDHEEEIRLLLELAGFEAIIASASMES